MRAAKKYYCMREEAIEWDTREGRRRNGGRVHAVQQTIKQVHGIGRCGEVWGES
jgi:hypothetical protein